MYKVLGFYTSTYGEPRNNIRCLGGEPNAMLPSKNAVGLVFNEVPEYESTNVLEDFRVIYLANISKNNISVRSVLLSISNQYDEHLDKSTKIYLNRVKIRMFSPTYAGVNYVHPLITRNGVFRDTGISLSSIMSDEVNSINYGTSISIKTDMSAGDFIPVVLHRTVIGPTTYIKGLRFNISARFSVRDDYE